MKNKFAAITLAALLSLGAVACGGGDDAGGGASEGTGGGASEATS